MATNNFLEFDSNKTNMQSDEEYTAEAQRVDGVSGIAKSRVHNKLFRQVSVMTSAIGEFIKNTGNTASDTDRAALVAAITAAFATKTAVDSKLPSDGDSKDNTVTFEDYTVNAAPAPEDVIGLMTTGKNHANLWSYVKAFLKGTITLAKVANNLVTTAAGLALDARQGKVLQDQLTTLNDNLTPVLVQTFTNGARLYKYGRMRILQGYSPSIALSANTWYTMSETILEGHRPPNMFATPSLSAGYPDPVTVAIETDGRIMFYGKSAYAASYFSLNMCWLV